MIPQAAGCAHCRRTRPACRSDNTGQGLQLCSHSTLVIPKCSA
ncbi:hypothetical protein [Pseudomonas sp. Irchel 3A5]